LTNEQVIVLIFIFVAVAGAVVALMMLIFGGVSRLRERLQLVSGEVSEEPVKDSVWRRRAISVAKPFARLATPDKDEEVSLLRARFLHAGLRQASAPIVYFAAKALLALVLPMLFIAAERSFGWKVTQINWMMVVLVSAAVGYYLPTIVLNQMTRIRQREIFESFPDALDLMIVCVEAGLALDMAVNRAGTEIRLRSPELADELDLVSLDLRIGSTRERALKNFAMRTGLDEVSTFVAMLIQADRFGTSLAESLRVHADGLRTRRQQRAEEAAAKIALKLLFPLIFFIFPSLMLVLLGPAFIQIYRVLLPTMGGGG
jgi:tight adherence protein C